MDETAETRKVRVEGLRGRIARMAGRLADLRKAMPVRQRLEGGLAQGVLSALAAVVAYLPTQALGLREGFWASITAIAVSQLELGATRSTGRDQVTGAAIGGVVGVAVALAVGQHLASYVVAVLISVMACWLMNIASAGRLAGITATIILLVPHNGTTPQHVLASRVGEVAWGVAVALALGWVRARLPWPPAEGVSPASRPPSGSARPGGSNPVPTPLGTPPGP